jgi:hypothetical protein
MRLANDGEERREEGELLVCEGVRCLSCAAGSRAKAREVLLGERGLSRRSAQLAVVRFKHSEVAAWVLNSSLRPF